MGSPVKVHRRHGNCRLWRCVSVILGAWVFLGLPATVSAASAVYVSADTATRGSWAGIYGQDGYMIANVVSSPPAYATVNISGDALWTWVASTSDSRALLQSPSSTNRIASCYYASEAFNLDVNLTDGQTHQVAIYALDWDNLGRSETISILDAGTHAVLDSRPLSGLTGGEYVIWNVTGHVAINVVRTGGANAVISGIFFKTGSTTPSSGSEAIYVFAHEDDWSLFMTPNAFNDVSTSTTKVVFICLTAGDAGSGAGPSGVPHPYYLAREYGMERAISFIANLRGPQNGTVIQATSSSASVNGHVVATIQYQNTITYFMNLPDGGFSGTGYASTSNQSIARLALNLISSITAVDNSATYVGWNDLVNTILAIVQKERSATTIWINYQNPDTTKNLNDHYDHTYAGLAAQTVAKAIPCLGQRLFLDYVISSMPPNLSTADLINKAGVAGNVESGRSEWGWPGTWGVTPNDLVYIPATYFTTLPSASPYCQ